jgi:hypothetical protein
MSKDIDSHIKDILKKQDLLTKNEDKINKEIYQISKSINNLYKNIVSINHKLTIILEILNSLQIIAEDDDEEEDLEETQEGYYDASNQWIDNADWEDASEFDED